MGDLANGCQRELNADIRGSWRVNRLFTKMLSLRVIAPTGSRIAIQCRGKRGACRFGSRVIAKTKRRTTSLTRLFNRGRILPAGTSITVRVTLRGRIGSYERLLTRSKRKLPMVTQRCIDHRQKTVRCA